LASRNIKILKLCSLNMLGVNVIEPCSIASQYSRMHVRYMCCLQRILAFTTSAADMKKRLLLSNINV
jgi:hypothetical protein